MPARSPSSATRSTTSCRCGTSARSHRRQGAQRKATRSRRGQVPPRRGRAPRAGGSRPGGSVRARPRQARDVRHRLEPQLHERLHHRLPVLRLLSEAGRSRGVDAHRGRSAGQDRVRRVQGRDDGAAPGRPQPGPTASVLSGPRHGDAPAVSAGHPTLLHRVGDPDDGHGEPSYDRRRPRPPVGGAEILSERVRTRIEPKKGGPAAWLGVHRDAHRRGFKSTATMMYGHVETPDDVVDHWEAIRELQDAHGGFTAFVPWSFKPGNTLLEKWIKHYKGPNAYLRMLAASRLYLDNFEHIQASWFSEGKRAGQIELHFGSDYWGGTLLEENVHKAADYVNTITVEDITALIREAGFAPVQRTTTYEIVKAW